jgi:hypothetical protein
VLTPDFVNYLLFGGFDTCEAPGSGCIKVERVDFLRANVTQH